LIIKELTSLRAGKPALWSGPTLDASSSRNIVAWILVNVCEGGHVRFVRFFSAEMPREWRSARSPQRHNAAGP
jgi:hypothetical protein